MSFFNPADSIGFHCSLTFKAFRQALEKRLQGTGISPVHVLALAHLMALGPLSQSELGDKLFITAASTARLVDRMERDGWVERQADPEDRRVNRLVITEKARSMWGEISFYARDVLEQASRGIERAEIEQAIAVLTRVRHNLENSGS